MSFLTRTRVDLGKAQTVTRSLQDLFPKLYQLERNDHTVMVELGSDSRECKSWADRFVVDEKLTVAGWEQKFQAFLAHA
jgi:hypothetical protein